MEPIVALTCRLINHNSLLDNETCKFLIAKYCTWSSADNKLSEGMSRTKSDIY